MSAHNFWNNFTHGFMHGMFSNNPFFGGCMGGWGGFFQFNSCFNPFFMPYTSCISPFPNNTSLFLVPNVMSGIGFSPLMPDFAMPAPSFNIDMNKLFPTDKWQTPAYSSPPAFGDVFVKSSNNSVTVPSIETSDYNFTFSSTKTKTSKAAKTTPATYQPSSLSSTRTTSLASLKAKHWTEMTDSEMRQVYGDYTRDITTPYKGTAADLNKYLEGKGVLSGQGQAFIDAQNKYGISAAVLAGIAISESGGTSSLARKRFNVTSISSSRGWRRFNNVSECIDYTASMLANRYVKNSGLSGVSLKTLYQINAKYCPVSDTRNNSSNNRFWAQNVENKVREIEKA